MNVNSRRLSILTKREIDDLYGLPQFNDEDRCFYFDLSADEMDIIDAVHTRSATVHLALQLGYFKAKRQFFVYPLEAVQDYEFADANHDAVAQKTTRCIAPIG
jgi:hypothetical protein